MILRDKTVLVTGGTGSFGTKFIEVLLERHDPQGDPRLQPRRAQAITRSSAALPTTVGCATSSATSATATGCAGRCSGVDVVVHAAALKQVPACEYNPFEAVQTNVLGAENVIDAAIDNDVPQTLALSTDKAVNPVNLYGATKLCAEKLVAQGNAYAGDSRGALRVRPLRQRRRQPRQRDPALQGAGASTACSRSPTRA